MTRVRVSTGAAFIRFLCRISTESLINYYNPAPCASQQVTLFSPPSSALILFSKLLDNFLYCKYSFYLYASFLGVGFYIFLASVELFSLLRPGTTATRTAGKGTLSPEDERPRQHLKYGGKPGPVLYSLVKINSIRSL